MMLLLICTRLFHNMQSYDDVTTPYKLLNWIQKDKLNYDNLSSNHKAVQLLEQNPDKILWNNLSLNPNAIHLLEQNVDKIEWMDLSANPNAIHLLKKYRQNTLVVFVKKSQCDSFIGAKSR